MLKEKKLNTFLLVGIFVSTILSIRNWPISAEYGLTSLFFIILAGICFLIPVALVSAELATAWPDRGGVFVWIREAFGYKAGVIASWFIWISNVVWYPTILSFISVSIIYFLSPHLIENKSVVFAITTLSFWGMVFFNLKGTQISGWTSSVCLFIGTIFPGALIIFCGVLWFFSGKDCQMLISTSELVPKFGSLGELVFFSGIILGFSGMEMPASHASEVKHPEKKYPKAIFISFLLIMGLSILGTFSVGLVIPKEQINFISAPIEVISIFLNNYRLGWAVPIMSLFLAIGALGGVSTWIASASKTLLEALQDCHLPVWVTKENQAKIPSNLLVLQGLIVTVLSLLFIFMPTLNNAFWFLTALASQLYVVAYMMLFVAAIRLRYRFPNVHRKFRLGKSNLPLACVCSIGILTTLFTFFIGFFPPEEFNFGNGVLYTLFSIGGIIILGSVPFLIREKKKPKIAEVL